MIPIRFNRGIELPAHGIWLDPWDAKQLAFVSHAHSDHIAKHREIIASRETSLLMQARLPGQRIEHLLEFGKTTNIHGLEITLFPAGHIFGSAQFFLQAEDDSLLYTGDFKLRASLSAEATEWRQADTLIMETTFGLPKYVFPPTEEVIGRMIAFCRETLDEGGVPVLLGYSLGKAQEILCALHQAGLEPMLHGSVYRMTQIYEKLRLGFPCSYLRYDARDVAGKVLICPPSANRSAMLRKIKNARTAILTGWAADPGAHFRYQTDAAFPLSDHADYPDLLRYVELVAPKRVLTLHGFASAFARDLRERGIEAWALSEQNQLDLQLGFQPQKARPVNAAAEKAVATVPSEFADFSRLCEQISATASKLKKIELLRDYLQSLNEIQLPLAAVYLTGKAFPQTDPRVLHTGWAVIKRAILAVSKIGQSRFNEISRRHADAGKTAHDALLERTEPEPFSLAESLVFFDALQRTRGPIAKGELLERRLEKLSPLEAQYLVKILTGDLRIGLKEGLVEEAIASACAAPLDDVKEANMLLGDIGETAKLAALGGLQNAALTLFRPIKCMLANPEPDAQSIWKRFGEAERPITAWAEDKFDGIRAQMHIGGDRVEIFSRDLKKVTEQFAEIADAARGSADAMILDGEIIAFERERKLTFFDLQKRLGRKTSGDFFLHGDIPVRFMAFDLLHLNGDSLLKKPLTQRRAMLEKITLPASCEVVPIVELNSAADVEAAFVDARGRLNEGLIVKDAASFYTPGRRGNAWIKFKKELATLDVVVVGAELGHGKRSQVLSDYTFAVRDDSTGKLLPIGKAYSGLTDEEIARLTRHFEASTIEMRGRYREVNPDVVLEVAFNSIQPSTRHASGLALRFPRIKAIRTDKTVDAIDTLAYARKLAEAVAAG